ncbi:hypothetical protein D3C76_1687630 [compost metagenome]
MLDRPDAGHAVEFVGFQRRDTAHFAQPVLQQRLPMFGNVFAQTGYDQNGGGSLQFVHVNTFVFFDDSTGFFASLFLLCPH